MRVGFTGTRNGMTHAQGNALLAILEEGNVILCHGDCVGADAEAHQIALKAGVPYIIIFPPIVDKHRAFCAASRDTIVTIHPVDEYLARNKKIVDNSLLLVAAPSSLTEEVRSGTWSTVRYARRIGVPVIILDP